MRRLRVRFSIGTLTLGVPLIAVNCWAFRSLDPLGSYYGCAFRSGPDDLEIATGLLPLANAAFVGMILFAARALKSVVRRRFQAPGSLLVGVTYFSFGFLVLGVLTAGRMPDLTGLCVEPLGAAWEHVEEALEHFAPDANYNLDRALQMATLAVVLSGPLLLLSLIGGLLARRCAATLPRWRFRVLTILVILGFAGVGFAIVATPMPFAGVEDVDLDFRIVDKETGRPIAAAFVCITDPFGQSVDTPRAVTDSEGRASLTGSFNASGEYGLFGTMGTFSLWGRWLEVSAPGFQNLRVSLSDVAGPLADLGRSRIRTIALAKGRTPEGPFRDIAGTYLNQTGMAGGRYVIEPDGRFSWSSWGGCSRSYVEEYGYLKRTDGGVLVVSIPRLGEDVNPLMTMKHRIFAWGERLYLVIDDSDVRRICRVALSSGGRSTNLDYAYRTYLRDADRAKPREGFPRLPAEEWIEFLQYELNPLHEDGGLRLTLKSLVPRNLRAESFRAKESLIVSF